VWYKSGGVKIRFFAFVIIWMEPIFKSFILTCRACLLYCLSSRTLCTCI